MTTYALESSLSLLLGLGLYRLLLENQPMHYLKRAYLLGTLLISPTAPVITLEVPLGAWPGVELVSSQIADRHYVDLPIRSEMTTDNAPKPVNYWLWFYATGTLPIQRRSGLCFLLVPFSYL